jgi:hypothetical protein
VATVHPADATNKTVTWESSNEAVATVSDGVITGVGNGEALITVTTQDGGYTATHRVIIAIPLPPEEIDLSEVVHNYEQLLLQFSEAWVQIDNDYSTYTSRLSLTSASPFLSDFWGKAYQCIQRSNLLLEKLESSNLPEQEKADYRGKAYAGRATAYFYLKTLWGGVPLVTKTPSLDDLYIPRSEVQDVLDLIYDDINRADVLSARPFTAIYGLLNGIIYMQENDGVNHAIETFVNIINSGELVFRDTNGDAIFNAQDDNTEVMLVHLLLAEAYLKTANAMEATQYINRIHQVFGIPLILPSDDIQAIIGQKYEMLSHTGMKFLNAVRRGETESWGYRALLPVPLSEIHKNPNLTQNPGW